MVSGRQDRERAWFEETYAQYARLLFAAGHKLLGADANDQDVGDLVQDVFLILWKQREELMEHPNIGGWLMMAMKYRAINLAKGKRRRTVYQMEIAQDESVRRQAVTPEQRLLLEERMQELRGLLGEENAALLVDYTLGGYSASELGRQYGLSEMGVYQRVSRMRKRLAVVLLALLLAALAVCGVAYCVQRGVLNFSEDMGFGPAMVVQQGAQELVEEGALARMELEHVIIDVLETAYDGHELRVVYGVTAREGTVQPIEGFEGSYMVPGAQEDGVHMCDYITVNGQDAYFYDAYEAVGENPNQLLYYLQTNLTAWDVDTAGSESLTIGLPMLPRDEQNPDGVLEFTIPAEVPQGMLRSAELVSAKTADYQVHLTCAEFSPLSGYVEILVEGLTRAQMGSMTGCMSEVLTPEGELLTSSHPEGNIRERADGVTLGFALMPTEGEWPSEMELVIYMDDGSAWTLHLALEP